MKHVYIIQRARGRRRRRSDIDIDTDIDMSYIRGDCWEVPVPIISVDVHLGYLSLNEPTGSAVVINCVIWDACMILVCVYKQHFTYVYLFICVSVIIPVNCPNGISYAVMCWEFFCCFVCLYAKVYLAIDQSLKEHQ